MCLAWGSGALVTPTDEGKRFAEYLRLVLVAQVVLAIVAILAGYYWDAIIALIALFGYLAIRNEQTEGGYAIQQLLCYLMFCGMEGIFTGLELIFAFSVRRSDILELKAWQAVFVFIFVIGAPIAYWLGCYIAYRIYEDLRMQYNIALQGGGGRQAPGGGGAGYMGGGQGYMVGNGGGGGGGGQSYGSGSQPRAQTQQQNVPKFTGKGYVLGSGNVVQN
eukprot:TRINITY_DN4177_c0_g1_i1.p1 TRINITY_DN4177_c0_g1~~TRINITY_DN4177_c0_g1_i1.p1  ORF type:complete len:219 (-),score=61.18 TRINITY_DN4177_c0_g1_i1:190-846(-)